MSKETGLLIRELREKNNLSSTEFGKILNVNKSSISKWETTGQVGIESLYQIARYFRITVQELIDGRLKTEGNPDYFKRNYDLSSFDLNQLISGKVEEQLTLYYEMCLRVKNRFLTLIPLYAEDKLKNTLVDEFKFLSNFVYIDNSVIPHYEYDHLALMNSKFDKNHMEAVRIFIRNLKGLPKEDVNWEMDKLVNFSFDLKIKEAIETQLIEPLKAIMPLLSQSQKDVLLESNLQSKTLAEISRNPYIAAMANGGANILYGFRDFHPGSIWDDEILSLIEGPITIDEDYKSAPKEAEFNERDSIFFRFRYGQEWKHYSLLEYKRMIDQRKTNQLYDLFNLKYQKPCKYYENLIAGKYDSSF